MDRRQRTRRPAVAYPVHVAIDPGNEKSGWVRFRIDPSMLPRVDIVAFGKTPNVELLELTRQWGEEPDSVLAIETPKPRGEAFMVQTVETCVYVGRFVQAWGNERWSYVHREDVKYHLVHRVISRDRDVRRALNELYGGESVAIGGKRCKACKGKGYRTRERVRCDGCSGSGWLSKPGPLHGFAGDMWAALAVACYYATHMQRRQVIMLKGDWTRLCSIVGTQVPLTAELRREHGMSGRRHKQKNKDVAERQARKRPPKAVPGAMPKSPTTGVFDSPATARREKHKLTTSIAEATTKRRGAKTTKKQSGSSRRSRARNKKL